MSPFLVKKRVKEFLAKGDLAGAKLVITENGGTADDQNSFSAKLIADYEKLNHPATQQLLEAGKFRPPRSSGRLHDNDDREARERASREYHEARRWLI